MLLIPATMLAGGDKDKRLKKVAGTVVDQEFETLAGVRIEVIELDQVIYTDLEGMFTLENVKPGAYTLKVSQVSFEDTESQVYTVDIENSEELSIQLKSK